MEKGESNYTANNKEVTRSKQANGAREKKKKKKVSGCSAFFKVLNDLLLLDEKLKNIIYSKYQKLFNLWNNNKTLISHIL